MAFVRNKRHVTLRYTTTYTVHLPSRKLAPFRHNPDTAATDPTRRLDRPPAGNLRRSATVPAARLPAG